MSTQGIGSSGYMDTYTLLQATVEQEQLYTQAAELEKNSTTNGATSALGADIMGYLSQIPKGTDGKLSFKDVDDYREELATKWDLEVMTDLEKLGVDITQELPLTYDTTTGKVTVASSCKEKEIVDKYFEDNPDKVKSFNEIVQLGKLTATADSKLDQKNYVQNLQQQAIAWWYADNSDPTSWFSGGGMIAGGGISNYTGLNLTV